MRTTVPIATPTILPIVTTVVRVVSNSTAKPNIRFSSAKNSDGTGRDGTERGPTGKTKRVI